MNKSSQSPAAPSGDAGQIAALDAELTAAREQLERATAEYEGMLSGQDAIQEDRDAAAQFVTEAKSAVSRLESALARAEAGTYGRCERCGAAIPSERLAALPDATTCVSCA